MLTGQYIDGRYKLVRPIGSGGMANVYLAEDLILEREVAIKVMRFDFRHDEDSIRRFRRESMATTSLSHPNIVSVYDIGEDQEFYIVMEYVDGPDLIGYIRENYPIPYRKVINIMNQVLSGVHYAHEQGIIHRDLKPQNILMTSDEHAMITDFGIAVALSQNSITQTNSLLGSVQYLSPEEARGSMASRRSDIYSLGVILYQMLANRVPFEGESAVSIALKHFQNEVPSLKQFDPEIPQSLENVVIKAMAKDPADRYSTAEEMRQDLATVLEPNRRNEAPLVIEDKDALEETKLIKPIKTVPIPTPKVEEEPEEVKVYGPTTEGEPVIMNSQGKPKKKRRWIIWPLLIILLTVFTYVYFAFFTGNQDVRIPDVTGLTEEQAIERLEEAALALGDIIEEESNDYDEGIVIRTNPDVNSSVKEGSEINLYVSSGGERVEVPDVTGLSYREARQELEDLGFTVIREEESSETVPSGDVIHQNIDAGEEVVPVKTELILTVSSGRTTFALRDLSGYSWQGVADYVADTSLNITRTEEYSDEIAEGMIISQSPEAGTQMGRGDRLEVIVSQGPDPDKQEELRTVTVNVVIPYLEPASTPAEDPSDSTEDSSEEASKDSASRVPNDIIIYVTDHHLDGTTPYRTLKITNSTSASIDLQLEAGESGSYRILRDGEVIEEASIRG